MPLSEEKRFDSWKEIACFLGRDIRTVRRWEAARGLPVHRVPGDGRRAIFAYQREIEAWLKSADRLSDNDNFRENISLTDFRPKRYAALVLGGCGVLVVAVAVIALVPHAIGAFVHIFGRHGTRILQVSPVYAATTQGIIIDGEGFGPPPKTILISTDGAVDTYAESRSTSMRIDDLGQGQHRWVAGRGGAINSDDIGVKLATWTDSRIVLRGFSGPVGTDCKSKYQIGPGDRLRIIVWGPENNCGPGGPPECPDEIKAGRVAVFETVALPSEDGATDTCH